MSTKRMSMIRMLPVLQAATWLALVSASAASAATPAAGKTLRDCRGCPTLVVVPAGTFTMGTPSDEPGRGANEGPQHAVTITRAFAAGVAPVTRDEFAAFVKATKRPDSPGCKLVGAKGFQLDPQLNWRNPGYAQTGKDPVACVSYEDASAYAAWLSTRTGKHYRLLSEAEWEYAARAGTTTAYWWGTTPDHEHANYGTEKCCEVLKSGRDQWDYTSPVGSFPANAFGLYDVSGNIFEWVQDCWHDNFEGAPADGSAWDRADCTDRAHRGSSWHASAAFIRIGYRVHDPVGDRNIYLGFRIARDL
jgi:sulfatase modifying factor 1